MKTNESDKFFIYKNGEPVQRSININFSNERLVREVDELLIRFLPDCIEDELKWIRNDYENDEISDFLCRDVYYSNSPLIDGINSLMRELVKPPFKGV